MEKPDNTKIKEELDQRITAAVNLHVKYQGIAEYLMGWRQQLEQEDNGDKQKKKEQE